MPRRNETKQRNNGQTAAFPAIRFPDSPAPRFTVSSRSPDWLIWQLADSAFPTGGFAHSAGLEAAWQHGEVPNREELIAFAEASLQQIGHASIPFVSASHAEPERITEFDQLCDAFTSNHVANRASRLQGRALVAAVERCFGKAGLAPRLFGAGERSALQPSHLAPAFGLCFRRLEIGLDTTLRLFLFSQLRGLLNAAVRLNIVGPMDAQSIQHQLTPQAEAVLQQCAALTLDELAQTSPLLDLWQGAQDRLYSRLFQS